MSSAGERASRAPTETRWLVAHHSPGLHVENLDGVWWHKKPVPRKWFHRHTPQTRALRGEGYWTYRCVCGATGYSDIPGWTKRERFTAPRRSSSALPGVSAGKDGER